ncbi:MAG: HYExAFE family protein [Phycisphaerales bacterium JB058]|jgi:hypothetical protein
MGQSRHHYEQALEAHLRARRIPYISVNEARRTLLPPDADLSVADPASETGRRVVLKSFDFVIYGEPTNLLVDVKGRKVKAGSPGRLESWVTEDDVEALGRWEQLFGEGFRAAFVFIYWCEDQPADALFQEIFEHRGRWYAVRSVLLEPYKRAMVPRSRRWRTVNVPTAAYERISSPLSASPSEEFRPTLADELEGTRFAPTLAAR